MRVLYFHQHFGTPEGSTGTRSYEFARALVHRGHRVTMVCGAYVQSGVKLPFDPRHKWSRGNIDGIDVIALPIQYSNHDGIVKRTLLFLRFAWRSAFLALREEYDLLFATSTPLTAAIPGIAMKLCRRRKAFVFEVRDLWPELPRALGMKNPFLLGGMNILEWMSYRCADACVGLSPGIVEGIARRSPKARRILMIPNGCDLELFSPRKRASLSLSGIQAGDFIAGFTGAHGIANGLDAILEVAAELKKCGRCDIKLVLIGDGKEKPALQARAQAKGLDNCLFFAPVKKTEIAGVTASFGCGLQILANIPEFYYGTSPNKFFDYISSGIPVVNNYPGWLASLITAHGCGIAVRPESPTEFAAALCRLADDATMRDRMGTAARCLAEREFNRTTLAGRFVDFLESVV